MKSTRRKVVLGLIAVILVAALIRLPVWADADQGVIPMLAISLLSLLSNVYVPSRMMPAGHRH
ncbi:MAG TPA: hypothetical protein VLM91_25445 [Candidatus Methylomirabilis sp.]|nr:hypothetical protein [Candidatus Methylomirabilis sp.]